MKTTQNHLQILPKEERYCIPNLNEIKIISDNQTLALALGSCISTVIIGKHKNYHLAANHIVIAKPMRNTIIATKSAIGQIEEILWVFCEVLNIKEFFCFHLLGAGVKIFNASFNVHKKNIIDTMEVLKNKNIEIMFNDTGCHFFSSYSITGKYLSIFIENNNINVHKSFVMDLDLIFNMDFTKKNENFPASMLEPENIGFESLVEKNIITSITGKRISY